MKQSLDFKQTFNFKELLEKAMSLPARQILDRDIRFYAAVALIFRENSQSKATELGMIRRALNPSDPWSGQMAFPGGKKDPIDKDLIDAVVRETKEEVGIDLITNSKSYGSLDEIRGKKSGKPMPLSITPFVYYLKNDDIQLNLDPMEVASFHWIPINHFFKTEHHILHFIERDDFKMDLPAINLNPVPIWGISYLMLKDLFERLFQFADLDELNDYFSGNFNGSWRDYPKKI